MVSPFLFARLLFCWRLGIFRGVFRIMKPLELVMGIALMRFFPKEWLSDLISAVGHRKLMGFREATFFCMQVYFQNHK